MQKMSPEQRHRAINELEQDHSLHVLQTITTGRVQGAPRQVGASTLGRRDRHTAWQMCRRHAILAVRIQARVRRAFPGLEQAFMAGKRFKRRDGAVVAAVLRGVSTHGYAGTTLSLLDDFA